MKNRKMKRENTAVVAVDFQERLMPAMFNAGELENITLRMVKGAKALNLPVLVTQQYTKGLGATISSISEALGSYNPVEKTTFSAMDTEEFVLELEKTGAKNILLMGIESHICVQQTAMDLIEKDYNVFLISDCCSSRKESDKITSLRRMEQAGVVITTYESALYELLGGAKAEGFKEISAIVK